jgi:hypothetical protein
MVFVSDQPCFKVLTQMLEILYTRVVITGINEIMFPAAHQPRQEQNTLEFYLSLMFYHLKSDSSNLQLTLVDDIS